MKNSIKKTTLVLLFLFSVSYFYPFYRTYAKSEVDLESYYELAMLASGDSAFVYNAKLASQEFEGRQAGTEGCNKAASYIASEFKKMNLLPFDKKQDSYFQSVTVPYFDVMSPLTFRFKKEDTWYSPLYRKDFIVFPYSGSGKTFGKFAFVGYGVTDKTTGYDDYDKIDVNNKAVVMFYQKPTFLSEKNDEFSTLSRIRNAKQHHASAVIFIQCSGSFPMFSFDMKSATGRFAELPVLYTNHDLSELILSINHKTIAEVEDRIEDTEEPDSFIFSSEMEFDVKIINEKRESSNVIGYIPSFDPNSKESIVIGAHYDHLGLDHILNTTYNGANDNASGTACMLEMARLFSSINVLPTHHIVFIAFTGEEEGLYGSAHYVDQPLFPLKGIKTMINMDMVGTGSGDLLAGTSSILYPELAELISDTAEFLEQSVPIDSSLLYPGSDHYFFHEKKIPSVFFFKLNPTNIGGYHTIADTIDTIDPDNLEKCSQLTSLVVMALANVSIIDFSTLPKHKLDHPYMIWDTYTINFLYNDLTLSLNDKLIRIRSDETFKLFCPIYESITELIFQVKYEEKVIREYKFHIFSDSSPNLRADFNQDNLVNVNDLVLLARNFHKKSPIYDMLSLYDLSRDEIIDSADFTIFSEWFDSVSYQKQ